MANVAQLGYSKETNQLELVVPHGTKTADLHTIVTSLQKNGIIARLPRGCNTCLSGSQFNIREKLQEVINVDLETYKVVGE